MATYRYIHFTSANRVLREIYSDAEIKSLKTYMINVMTFVALPTKVKTVHTGIIYMHSPKAVLSNYTHARTHRALIPSAFITVQSVYDANWMP